MDEEAVSQAVKSTALKSADGSEDLTYIAHRLLESERQMVMSSAFDECKDGRCVAVTAKSSDGEVKELIYAIKGDSNIQVQPITGSCQITYEDLYPSDCIEYAFAEEPGNWAMAQISLEAVENYRGMKFGAWKQMISQPTCEAQFRRMIQIGLVTQMYDPHVFPTPDSLKPNYQVTDEKTGKLIVLPHPLHAMRIWDPSAGNYKEIEALLTGAPSQAEASAWWKNFWENELVPQHGKEYLEKLMGAG